MVRRYFLKVLIFAIVISYFSFYKYNNQDHHADEGTVSHLTTLLLHEQQLLKQLNITMTDVTIPLELAQQHNMPYIEGKLLSLTQLTDHIVLAKFTVSHTEGINLKQNEHIAITYTGYSTDEFAPVTNKLYRILIKVPDNTNDYYYIQGGLKGIIPID